MNDKILRVQSAIKYIQDDISSIAGNRDAYRNAVVELTTLLDDLICEDNAQWETACPPREPVTAEDLSLPLLGDAEKTELAERLYRVLHIVTPSAAEKYDRIFTSDSNEFPELQDELEGEYSIFIYDVEKREVVCEARNFFHTMDINEFAWRG
jgi:hypothetical protein